MTHTPSENSSYAAGPQGADRTAVSGHGPSRRRLEIVTDGTPVREQHVRIGEAKVASGHGDVLTAIGLGSCIGVVIADSQKGVVAMAHVFLPYASRRDPGVVPPGKYADLAIPQLLELLAGYGCTNIARLSAAIVGGARMFELDGLGGGNTMDVGARNLQAVHEQLERHGVRVVSSVTGGTRGRTMRAYAGSCVVTAQEVTAGEELIWPKTLRTAA